MKEIEEIVPLLDEPLDMSIVMENYGDQLYLPSHEAIDSANRIFGYHMWSYETKGVKDMGGFMYQAVVKATVSFLDSSVQPELITVMREDVGVGIAAVSSGKTEPTRESCETAIKSAVTDALKRCLRTFGNQFGNQLYNKDAKAQLRKEYTAARSEKPSQQTRATTARPAAPRTAAPARPAAPRAAAPTRPAATARPAAPRAAAPPRPAAPVEPQQQEEGFKAGAFDHLKSELRLANEAASDPNTFDFSVISPLPPDCPGCGGPMWDQVASDRWGNGLAASGNARPVYKCKDKECGKTIWVNEYMDGVNVESYYNPPESRPGSDQPAPSGLDEQAEVAQIADLEILAEKLWGENWPDKLEVMATESGAEEYFTCTAQQAIDMIGVIQSQLDAAV